MASRSLCLADMAGPCWADHITTRFVKFLPTQNFSRWRKFTSILKGNTFLQPFFLTSCCVTVALTGRKGPVSCRYTYFHTFTWSSAAIPRYALNVGASPPSRMAYTNTDKGLFVSSGKPAVILISSFRVFILKKMTSAISCVLHSPQVLAGDGR